MCETVLVMQRDGKWHMVHDGARLGTFDSREEAEHWAKQLAYSYELSGQEAEVAVDDPDDGVPVIYASACRQSEVNP